jgi:hypothetical protein
LFPHAIVIPMSNDMTITQWHVPVDDESCYWYAVFTSFSDPVDKATMRAQRLELYQLPDYRPRLNRSNNWGYDPHEQDDKTYTGMGLDINVHDQWAVESLGAVQDRTQEHLGTTDKAITATRRKLRKAIEAAQSGKPDQPATGGDPSDIDPIAIDAIVPAKDWAAGWQERAAQRRKAAPWANGA